MIQRADELAEFVAIYWKDGRVPLSAQAKRGLKEMKTARVLPFRFVAAARYAPQWETPLEQAMFFVCRRSA